MLSWNVRGAGRTGLHHLMFMTNDVQWDFIAVQEVSLSTDVSWQKAGSKWSRFKNHLVVFNPVRSYDTALIIHRRHAHQSFTPRYCDHSLGLRMQIGDTSVVVGSAHFPDS